MICSVDSSVVTPPLKRTFGLNGCPNCILKSQCGGHPLPLIRKLGCVNFITSEKLIDTDDMNPLFPERFWKLWDDVNGLVDYQIGPLRPIFPSRLPQYIAKLQHRNMKRSRLLDAPIVALRLFDVVGKKKDGSYGAKYRTASELRRTYKLRQDTAILLIGVDVDAPLENFWANHLYPGVCESISELGVIGVTVPNFSYFTCVPRFQVMRNRKRILLTAERLSAAGVPVAPHINANTTSDWDFAYVFMSEHPEVTVITMEFETGARTDEQFGRETFNQLVKLQNRLSRPIHPILVGAARFFLEAKEHFSSFTVVDSQPFMQAIHRQLLTYNGRGGYVWSKRDTLENAPLDDLIETNILLYPDKLNSGCEEMIENSETVESLQGQLALSTSMPYLTAQPLARSI